MNLKDEYEITKLIYKLENVAEKLLKKPEDEIIFNTTLHLFERLLEECHHSKEFEITNEWFVENILSCCDSRIRRRERLGLPIKSEENI